MMDVDPGVVRACQRGEPGALDALIRATYTDVYNLALRLVRDREEAADVTQEVFVRVLRSVAGFRGESSFATWLHRVTVNTALTSMRRRARRPMLGRVPVGAPGESGYDTIADPDPGPEERAERAELLTRAQAAVAALPESSRTIVLLRDVEGLSTAEVATLTGLSETAVKVRLFRARERLRASLSDDTVTRLPRRARRGSA
ncbi:MAG TPA: sigma-70 family RNA polymerase sigma factor [Mycobacteriales bacterium]|nr:sigma-70 family RNA polymerase sigma factor [Mycobacteriales bacterium]